MATGWYVLHTYAGYEKKIEKSIRMLIDRGELDKEVVRDVKVLSEEVVEVKDGKKKTSSRKYLPGYILVEMDLPNTSGEWKLTYTKIKKIQGVSAFVGTPEGGGKPKPLSSDEARSMLQKAGEMKGERPVRSRQSFEVKDKVKIIGGPFATFSGEIEEVNADKNRLKVMVEIFNRKTPVEVELSQVEKDSGK